MLTTAVTIQLLLSTILIAAPPELEPGVTLRVYDIGAPLDKLYELVEDQTPNVDERRDVIDFTDGDFGGLSNEFVAEVIAWIDVPQDGEYAFRLTSDDGSRLDVDGERLIVNDGVHAAIAKVGTTTLEAGLHRLDILMFENGGGEVLKLEWRSPDAGDFVLIPVESLFTEAGVTRVTSPGRKQIMWPGGPRRPGDRLALDGVHPSWTVETIRPESFQPRCGAIAFLPDGRLAVTTFEPQNNGTLRQEPNGTLWVLEHVLGDDPERVNVVEVTDQLHDPSGAVWHEGALYVCERNEIARFTDTDGDGILEHRETFASGWSSDNYHHFTFGLVEHDGFLYAALSTSIYFDNTVEAENVRGDRIGMNGPNPPHRGCVLKVSLLTGEVEYIAGGLRTPNGVGIGPEGDLFVSDNQGAWKPSNMLYHVRPGHFYGHYNNTTATSDRHPGGGAPSLFSEFPITAPAVALPQNECSNSPTNPIMITDGPFAGQMYLGELTAGGIRRVFLEKVNGVWQGAAFRFTQGFEAGVQRIKWGPDGCMYIAGQGGPGNWSWRGTQFGLQRLRPKDATAFEMHSVRATSDGFVVRFTEPVAREQLEDLESYLVTQWRYEATGHYGGPKIDETELSVAAAIASDDGYDVRLIIPGLKQGHTIHLRTDPDSIYGNDMWSTEAWYTLNHIPLPYDAANLVQGDTLDGWHAIGGGNWTIRDGVITGTASAEERDHGLLVSDGEYDDFIVEFDYRVTQGDSGFYFRAEETDDAVGVHGFQIEVDLVEPGGLYETAGRAWVVKPDPQTALRWHTPGEWNHVRMTANETHIRVESNGEVSAELLDDRQGRRSGRFALQLHGGQDMHVQYRNIRLVELD